MGKFNHGKWIKQYKEALVEKKKEEKEEYKGHKPDPADDNIKKKGQSVHSKDLLHTTKVDGKKAGKVDMKIGAENDLAIEKDKDGMDVYAGGLREAFTPGDMWSDDFDYVGMLKFGAESGFYELGLETLKDLYESFTDVNYHTEAQDLGIAIDYMEDPGQDANQAQEKIEGLLEDFREACMKTLKGWKIKWQPDPAVERELRG